MKLLIQPADGVTQLVKAIDGAKRSVEIMIFRFDHPAIEKALSAAVKRGVEVTALIACTNRGGEDALRKLEQRLLSWGAVVARSADNLIRYHAKLLIVDRKQLYVLGFNFTRLDIERSRGFGLMTSNRRTVLEAAKLFEADSKRQNYTAGLKSLIVSPSNAREQLTAFLAGAKKQLIIYDPEVSDPAILRLLNERIEAGVSVRVIGLVKKQPAMNVRERPKLRLHARAIVRDGRMVFIGSQSLRRNELDKRREVGIVFDNARIAARIAAIFEEDWSTAKSAAPPAEVAKSVANAVANELPPVAPIVADAVRQLTGAKKDILPVNKRAVEETVKNAVKDALKGIVRDAVEKAS